MILHFIAGMPRSGSTLLATILRQNPNIHATITSPMGSLFERLHQCMGARSDYDELLTEVKRFNLLAGLFESYYLDVAKPVIFDTHRMWCARMPALAQLFPNAKVIACVRDPAWVLDSFEQLYQQNPLLMPKMFTPEQSATLHTRVECMAAAAGSVGFAYDAVAEAYYGPHRGKLIVIDYDAFVADPAAALAMIYERLELTPFEHQFDNVSSVEIAMDAVRFDRPFGTPGLHTVRPKVEALPQPTVLPPDLFKRFSGKCFWKETK
jgi:sulfotransferase